MQILIPLACRYSHVIFLAFETSLLFISFKILLKIEKCHGICLPLSPRSFMDLSAPKLAGRSGMVTETSTIGVKRLGRKCACKWMDATTSIISLLR